MSWQGYILSLVIVIVVPVVVGVIASRLLGAKNKDLVPFICIVALFGMFFAVDLIWPVKHACR